MIYVLSFSATNSVFGWLDDDLLAMSKWCEVGCNVERAQAVSRVRLVLWLRSALGFYGRAPVIHKVYKPIIQRSAPKL